jgi:class 3 adenylate cyclase
MHFKKDRFLTLFFVLLGGTLLVLLSCLLWLWQCQKDQIENFEEGYASYQIANQMRQSSDDLTKMVRLYVLTGNKKYLDAYNEILSIRNGTSPRPLDYDEIYWDFVLDPNKRPRPYGPAISLKQLMINHNFSEQEFRFLAESELKSNTLVEMEEEAIYAMQGLYDNGSGTYSVVGAPNPDLARRLVSDSQYMEQKAKIMEPLFQFDEQVEKRIAGKTEDLESLASKIILISIFFAVFATVLMVLCLLKSIKSLSEAAKTNESLLLNMLPAAIAERVKRGDETIVDEYHASVLFVQMSHFTKSFSADAMSSVFDQLDELTKRFGVEKIQVVGDSQVVVAGIPVTVKDHEVLLADFALALKKEIESFNSRSGLDLHIRMGLTSGTVVAGVVGRKKFVYDLWGDVVTLAAALEACGVVGEIQISEGMAQILQDIFEVEERGVMNLPSIGPIKTFFLRKRKIEIRKVP